MFTFVSHLCYTSSSTAAPVDLCGRLVRCEIGRLVDCGADAQIGSAAAQIAVHGGVDIFVGGLRRLGEQRRGGHHLSGLAVAALRHVDLLPGDLHRMRAIGERPSMVVIGWLPTAETGVRQERTGLPFRCTVQAPHWPMPQPYLVP